MNPLAYTEMQVKYGPMPAPMYGVPYSPPSSTLVALFSLLTTPIIVITSFIIGSILYLITHKKIFIFIPLILSFLYLIRYPLELFFGISF